MPLLTPPPRNRAIKLFFCAGMLFCSSSFAGANEPMRDEFFWLGEINKATVVINGAQGLLDQQKSPHIAKALHDVLKEANETGKRPRTVITFEPLLIKKGGVDVTLLHAGRSSQDMHATFRAAILRDKMLELATRLEKTSHAILALAEKHQDTIVPNYTNGVAAQPNSYAHYLLGHLAGFERDAQRIREAYARIDRSPMGTTVLNGTGWPLNREKMADYLGFNALVDNAYDASQISSMDQPVEAAAIITGIALHIGIFIEDIMPQYSQSRPWIVLEEGDGNTYVSSAMPQKRNPGLLNSTRSLASQAITLAIGPVIQTHNIVPGMNDPKDIKNNAAMINAGIKALAHLERVVKALAINPERALEELNSDWTASQEIADQLMQNHGIPFREGHHVASEIVNYARQQNITPPDFPYEEARRIYAETVKGTSFTGEFPMSEQEFRAALDPVSIVRNRKTSGGAQPAEVTRMLKQAKAQLSMQRTWIKDQTTHIATSLEKLDQDFETLMKK